MNAKLKSMVAAWLLISSVVAVVGWILFATSRDENRALVARLQLVEQQQQPQQRERRILISVTSVYSCWRIH